MNNNNNNRKAERDANNGGGGKAKGLSYSELGNSKNQGTTATPKSDSKAVKDKENQHDITSPSAKELRFSSIGSTKQLELTLTTADNVVKKEEVTNSDGAVISGGDSGALEGVTSASKAKRKRDVAEEKDPGGGTSNAAAIVGTAKTPAVNTSSKGSDDDDDSKDGASIGCFGANSKGGLAFAIGAVLSKCAGGGKGAFQPAVEEKKDDSALQPAVEEKKDNGTSKSTPALPNSSDPSSSQPPASFGASDPSQQAKSSDAAEREGKRRKTKPSDSPDSKSDNNSFFGDKTDFEGIIRPDVNEKLETQRKKIQVLTTEDKMNKATITSLEGEKRELQTNMQGMKGQLEDVQVEVQQARAATEEANRRRDAVAQEAATRVSQLQARIGSLANDVAHHQAEEERLRATIRSAEWLLRNA